MKIQLATLGLIAAVGFAACETVPTNNATTNRTVANGVANGSTAVVTNTNTGVNSNVTTTTTTTTTTNDTKTTSGVNFNGTREEINKRSTEITTEAKRLGGSIGTGANDTYIWTKTRLALTAENDLRDSTINVDVNDGNITLKGSVANKEQKAVAAKIANSIEGKKSVKDELTVKASETASPHGANTHSNAAPVKKS